MKLLCEYQALDYSTDEVSKTTEANGGKMVLKGVIQRADALNQNGRVYPRHILEREIRNYQKFIRERRAMGEIDHPDSSVVELKNVSHIVTEAVMQGNEVVGTIEILDTPGGQILKNLVNNGITLGISSRGVGSTKREGDHDVVQEDFQLICFDMVSEPSTNQAFLYREGKEISPHELRKILNHSDRIDRVVNDILAWKDK